MTLRAIRVTAALGRDGPERCELGPDLARTLAEAKAEPGPVVLLLCDDDLGRLDDCRELIVDRGRKHPAKALAPLLLGQQKIPLIRGGHTSPGQLLRSLRALVSRAAETGDDNAFLVGADAPAFEALWTRAEAPATDPGPAAPAKESASRPGSNLSELLPELPVPDSVRERFVGDSPETRLVLQLVLRAARQEQPVLILGDTGTGKEVVARLIHDQSARRLQSFTAVNCGAIPRELLESELFGYEKGAHSTATARKTGLWQRAHGGTLFLDEIADLSLDHQVKIFRALEHGEIRPVGAEREIKVDARVLAATNRDLFAMMQAGEFREDLYYRLRAFMIRTPVLRDHPEDIPGLAGHFWMGITHSAAARLPADVVEELARYRWPGNARELRMVLSSLFALFGTEGLSARHLRAVFEFEGQIGLGSPGMSAQLSSGEVGLHRAECLRQLRRTAEVLRAVQVELRPLRSHRPALEAPASLASVVEHRVSELELLCLKPLLFHGEVVFSIVRRIKDHLRALADSLRADPGEARAVWRRELEGDLTLAGSTIFKEVHKLVTAAAHGE
jgi:DNA-binding NtrC family response regulator